MTSSIYPKTITFSGDSIECAANTRTSYTTKVPSNILSHKFWTPIIINSGDGYVQASLVGFNSNSVSGILHSIKSATIVTPRITCLVMD